MVYCVRLESESGLIAHRWFKSYHLLYYKNTSHDSLLDGRFGRYDLMVVHDY